MRSAAWVLALGSGILAASAQAQDANFGGADNDPNAIRGLHVTFGAGLQETLTDNVRGTADAGNLTVNGAGLVTATPGSQEADLVTRIQPSVSIFDVTRKMQLGLSYSPTYTKFVSASDLDRFDNFLTGTGRFDVWQDHLFVNATASVSREVINSQGALTTAGISSSQNQTGVETYTLSPTFTQRFGNFSTAQLNYLFGYTSSGATAPATQNSITGSMLSGNDFNQLQWSLSLAYAETSQGSQPNSGVLINTVVNPTLTGSLRRETAQAGLGYALYRWLTLNTAFGYERITDDTLVNNQKGPFGSFGFTITGSRLNLSLNYNLRYGSEFVSTQGTWNVSDQLAVQLIYGESIQTQQSLAIQNASNIGFNSSQTFINPVTHQPFTATPLSLGVNNGLGNVAFLDKSGQLIITGVYDRDTWSVMASTDNQSTTQANFNQTTLQFGGTYGRDLTFSTRFGSSLRYIRTSQTSPTTTSQDIYSLSAQLSYDLTQDLIASTGYSFLYRRSSQSGQDSMENALTVTLNKTF